MLPQEDFPITPRRRTHPRALARPASDFLERRQAEAAVQEKGVAGVVSALNTATQQLLNEMMPTLVAKVENDYRDASNKTAK
jgi:hypothetical protein